MKEEQPVRAILLDFDGVVCDLFAGYPSEQITQELIHAARQKGYSSSLDIDDPLELLRQLGEDNAALAHEIDHLFAEKEYLAAESAQPLRGMHDFFSFCKKHTLSVVIVTNNSPQSIKHYQELHSLPTLKIFGRVAGKPTLLKPSSYSLDQALQQLNTPANQAVMVGDMLTDIQAAQAASCRSIGISGDPELQGELKNAGATHIVANAKELQACILKLAQKAS